MIVKVQREDIEQAWPVFQLAAEEALPPYADASMASRNNIHEMLLVGALDGWLVYCIDDDDRPTLYASVITSINTDDVSGTKVFEVYAMYGYHSIPFEIWEEMALAMRKYAKARGCRRVVAYTNNPVICRFLERLGGLEEYKFFVWEIDDADING